MLTKRNLERAAGLGPVTVDLEGLELTERERARLRHPLTGLVILFSRNYASREQLAALCAEIHAERPGIVIAVDHEGGRVQRFREDFTHVPAMARLREAGPAAFWAAGFVLGAELRACGVDMTFAPVLDIDYGRSGVIGDRALGETCDAVIRHGAALTAGLAEAGMSACGKHYPGHGWAEADSHVALPVDERSRDAVEADLAIYEALAPSLGAAMTAHVAYKAFGGEVATYSPELLRTILRDRLGFTGLLFSDDLSMKGAVGNLTVEERARRALDSGCDALLHCNHPDEADELLTVLEWERGAHFNERLARLMPADAGLEHEALEGLETYRRALEKLSVL